ncbi:ribonuclease 3-like isoform X1 [Penaeus chinensis]|uniref:ribonuclease 3-like isoform X1 n=1 Tax=Penaeus chinensis TaxID=139456 RepID=UPI001FB7B5D8|nr:ribonuclease 3-like isoform X1 [Penaeus chinensis]XP_047476135.1 ribonuclease 3-like isoform X1 [Penaeus chinensis]
MSSGPSWAGGPACPQWPYVGPGNGPPPQWGASAGGMHQYPHNQPPPVNAPPQNWANAHGPPPMYGAPNQGMPEAAPPDHYAVAPQTSMPNQYNVPQHSVPQGPPSGTPSGLPSNGHFGPPPVRSCPGPVGIPQCPSVVTSGPLSLTQFPPPGPSPGPPPGPGYVGTPMYGWGVSPPPSSQMVQTGQPPPGSAWGGVSPGDIHHQTWQGSDWDSERPHRPHTEDLSTRSGIDRSGVPSRNSYRDNSRGRDHDSSIHGQDRSSQVSSRSGYEDDLCSIDSRYKESRSYSDAYSSNGWRDRHGRRRKRSRSPSDYSSRRIESRNRTEPRRCSRDSRERSRYDSDRKERYSRSPGSHSRSSSRPLSPERKRSRPSWSPDRHKSRSPIKEMGGKRKKRNAVDLPPEEKEECEPLPTIQEEEKSKPVSKEEELEEEEDVKAAWVRSAPADLYYQRDEKSPLVMRATKKLMSLCEVVEEKLIMRGTKIREEKRKAREKKEQQEQHQAIACRNGCLSLKKDKTKEQDGETKESPMENIAPENSTSTKDKESGEECNGIATKEAQEDVETANNSEVASLEVEIVKNPSSEGMLCESVGVKCKHKHKHKHRHISKENNDKDSEKGDSSSNSSSDSDSDNSTSSDDDDDDSEMDRIAKELEKKRNHPDRLHPELWFNDPGEMNDGPLCRCSLKAQRSGIRHGYYVGEDSLKPCDPWTNNADHLHHYLITISPPTNFLIKTPTVIMHDSHEFIFEGFSLLSHNPLEEVPTCKVIRFNIEYTILYLQEKIPDNFCVRELDIFYKYLFTELLELVDLNLHAMGDPDGCPRFHFMPRFVRKLADNGKEILSMNEVLTYLLKNSGPLVQPEDLAQLLSMSQYQWQNYADQLKGMVVTCPGMKPCSIRVDQLDRDQVSEETINYPVIVHFGIRPPQLSYAGNPEYQKAWREYVKFRHLLANMPKPSFEDKRRLEAKENRLQEMRMTSKMKRDVTVAVSAQGFYRSGIMCDVVQHAMLLPVLVCHLRFHCSLEVLEERILYKFRTRFLLQLALTHPSYRENFGTNPDHARNSLTNCGIRQPEYGDRRIHYMNTRKRGINTLINIMSRFGRNLETESKITHNERLEFLGDAVVEFLTSIHLFHLFPSLEEGGLATYRAAIVQNQHLAVLAEKLGLDQFMLYAHGSDLCHDFELRHAMANCFEALMGAIFLDTGIEEADSVLSSTLFKGEDLLHNIWVNYPPHPIQMQEPQGDRKWIKSFPILTNLSKFEESIGVHFNHIRLLARAFTDRSIGFNNLTLGSNQRLEFLGDTVLQLVASEYLYKYFPEHHEGHLSLLRSSLVNNRTQAVVCDDLGMTAYAMYSHLKTELKTKDRADLLEAFLGALYIDRGLDYCRAFCQVCFFPRLHQFIMNQDWNDPKSKLQQCCLTLRTMDGGEPDIPIYKVIECKGPTNTRVYTVAVYFRGRRLAKASGHSIQQAEMNAAREALLNSKELFPQLDHQRRVIEKSVKIQGVSKLGSPHRERDRGRDKDRERERSGRGYRREEERRGDKERGREREKPWEERHKEGERSRGGDSRGRVFGERDQLGGDRERDSERNKANERDKFSRERDKLGGERDRLTGERDRPYSDRSRSTGDRKYKIMSDEERRYRSEAEKLHDEREPSEESKLRTCTKGMSRDNADSERNREKYKGYMRIPSAEHHLKPTRNSRSESSVKPSRSAW